MKTEGKGNTAAHKLWSPLSGPVRLPMVTWKAVITDKWQSPAPSFTIGKGFTCFFPENGVQPNWIWSRLTAETSKESDEMEEAQETAESLFAAVSLNNINAESHWHWYLTLPCY